MSRATEWATEADSPDRDRTRDRVEENVLHLGGRGNADPRCVAEYQRVVQAGLVDDLPHALVEALDELLVDDPVYLLLEGLLGHRADHPLEVGRIRSVARSALHGASYHGAVLRRRQSTPTVSDEGTEEVVERLTPNAEALLAEAAQQLVQLSRSLDELRARVDELEQRAGSAAEGPGKPGKDDLSPEQLDEIRQTKARAKRAARLRGTHRPAPPRDGER